MPNLRIGQKPKHENNDSFISLREKGDYCIVRIIGDPFYMGQHYVKEENKFYLCPRINNDEYCEYCNKYFELKKKANELPENSPERKKVEDEARKYAVDIKYYYPVINRETGKAGIMKVPTSVRRDIDEEESSLKMIYPDGSVTVRDYDYMIKRLKKTIKDKGKDWYSMVRVPETKPLTEGELAEKNLAESWNLEEKVMPKNRAALPPLSSNVNESEEAPDTDDIPF